MAYLTLKFRVIVLVLLISVLFFMNLMISGNLQFLNPQDNFIFYNLLFAIIMGLVLKETKFTTPTHSLINSLAILLALILFKDKTKFLFYKTNLLFFLILAVVSIITIFIYEEDKPRKLLSEICYKLTTFFGRASVAFSTVFIFAVFSFYVNKPFQFWFMTGFWVFVIFLMSANTLVYLQDYLFSNNKINFKNELGKIVEEYFPGVITVLCYKGIEVRNGHYFFILRENIFVYKVFKKLIISDGIYCKGALVAELDIEQAVFNDSKVENKLYLIGDDEKLKIFLKDKSIAESLKNYVGLVSEQTDINSIRFKVISDISLEEGYVLMTKIGEKHLLYQIVNVALSLEKISEVASAGSVNGIAQQIGEWNPKTVKFDKYGWVPRLYSPVYLVDKEYKIDFKLRDNELTLGYIPNTQFPIIANVDTLVTHHTAILGITGCGKTELAFTIIDKMIQCKTKLFCVDFTGDYYDEFKDFNPEKITIPQEKSEELNQKLFEVETGDYGAGKEKKALDGYKKVLIPEIEKRVKDFIESDKYLGVFELSEITNTLATVAITELYISSLFKYAREHRGSNNKYCIVLEEAHTIIPEERTMGVEDKFSKATISKICQIALQGRKYKVGLLVIAQRTANVTKTVLNQCNSIIVFNSFDKTGLDFMENYIGKDMIQAVPNLKRLQSVVAGRGFKSGRPLIMEVPKKEKFDGEVE